MSLQKLPYALASLLTASLLLPLPAGAAPDAAGHGNKHGVPHAAQIGHPITTSELMGKRVNDANGNDIGEIEDIIVSPHGRVTHALVSFGGFLNIGEDLIPVPWAVFEMNRDFVASPEDSPLYLKVGKARLEQAPRMTRFSHPLTTSTVTMLTKSDEYFADEIKARHKQWMKQGQAGDPNAPGIIAK